MLKILISPAKKMNIDSDVFQGVSVPYFIEKAEFLRNILKSIPVTTCKHQLNVQLKTIKLLEGKILCDFELGNCFLAITSKAKS